MDSKGIGDMTRLLNIKCVPILTKSISLDYERKILSPFFAYIVHLIVLFTFQWKKIYAGEICAWKFEIAI